MAAGEFVSVESFLYPDEAQVASSFLRSSGIVCYLENEHTQAVELLGVDPQAGAPRL